MYSMSSKLSKESRGFTLIEILVVLSVLVLITGLTLFSFRDLNRSQALDKNAMSLVSLLEEARSLTLASKDDSEYGVYFGPEEVVLFKGEDFNSGEAVRTFSLHSIVEMSDVLGGSSDQVVFERLTGKASASGTVTLSLKNNPDSEKVIEIFLTGIVEVN
jgi:prepilin-type N-terminal cleavage/methylation domain-containing protein